MISSKGKAMRRLGAGAWAGRNGKELREEVGYRDAPASRKKDAHG